MATDSEIVQYVCILLVFLIVVIYAELFFILYYTHYNKSDCDKDYVTSPCILKESIYVNIDSKNIDAIIDKEKLIQPSGYNVAKMTAVISSLYNTNIVDENTAIWNILIGGQTNFLVRAKNFLINRNGAQVYNLKRDELSGLLKLFESIYNVTPQSPATSKPPFDVIVISDGNDILDVIIPMEVLTK